MSRDIILVAGSPSSTSRSSFVAQVVAGVATRAGLTWRTFSLGDFEPADVLYGRGDAPAVKVFLDAVNGDEIYDPAELHEMKLAVFRVLR
jgi:NAD(P)H-dependent FMN reductase